MKQHALRLGEQVMTPINQRGKRLMTRHRGPFAACQQLEAVMQPFRNFFHSQ